VGLPSAAPRRCVVSLYDYEVSRQLAELRAPFYALLMAAFREADTHNLQRLAAAFPAVHAEVQARYDAPGGMLPDELERTPLDPKPRPKPAYAVPPPKAAP
jgi:hypothetical protein